MKLTFQILFLFILLTVFGFCSPNKNKPVIGVLFDSYEARRFQKEKIYFEEKIAELGGISKILSCDGNGTTQEQQAKSLIDEGADVLIIIASNVNKAASIVRYAHANKVKVIAYDRLIRNCALDFYFSFDGYKVGQLLGEYATAQVPKGNYVLLNGAKLDENATIFYNGTQRVLKPLIDKGDIEIIYKTYIDEWSETEAKFIMNKILALSSKKIDVVISQYDGLSKGVLDAIEENNIEEKIIITGQDAEVEACKRILKGEQSMTVYKPVKNMAYKCIEFAFDILSSNVQDADAYTYNGRIDVSTYLFDPVIVDENNMEATVVKDGFITMEEMMN